MRTCCSRVLTIAALFAVTAAQAQRLHVLSYSSSPETKQRRLTLRRDGNQVVLVDDATRAVIASSDRDMTRHVIVNGLQGDHTDTLTVDLRGGLSLPDGVDFNAGVGGFDTLNIVHDPARLVRFDYQPDDAGGHRGRVVIDGMVIAYSGIEPLTNTGTAADVVFNLPSGTVGASLQDDGTLGNNVVQIASTNATFEATSFSVPTNSLTINAGGGTDTITTAPDFSGDFHASLTINGASLTDVVTLNGLTLSNPGALLSVTAKSISVLGGISTGSGAITLSANQGPTPASGNFVGIHDGAPITSVTGPITLLGKGGDTSSDNYGLLIDGGAVISSTGTGAGAAPITLLGMGGAGTSTNIGVLVRSLGTTITSKDGPISITGTGGAGNSVVNFGFNLFLGAQVISTGAAPITIMGQGGGTGGSTGNNDGVNISQSLGGVPPVVTSLNGPISILGIPGPTVTGLSLGLNIGQAGGTVQSTGTATITLTGDSINLTPNAIIDGASNTVTLKPQSAGILIDLGGSDFPGAILGLDNAELARITAGTLVIGNATNTGGISVNTAITAPGTWNSLSLVTAVDFTATAGGSLMVPVLTFTDASNVGHVWTIDPAGITEVPATTIPYSTTLNLTVNGGSAADTFQVTPSSTTTFNIDGNNPIPPIGDELDVNQTGTTSPTLTATPSAAGFSGAYTFGNRQPVNFSHIESFAPTHFVVSAPATTTAGNVFSLTVTAFDQFNDVASGYSGTVHFTSSDPQAIPPADFTLTNGTGTFFAMLRTSGNQTITATDTVTPSITGTSNAIAVSADVATHFTVTAPANATAGSPFNFTVTAFDQFNNIATGYGGVVHFSSSDGAATLPGDSTLTNGIGTLSASLRTIGNQTITATDTVMPITATSNPIAVSAAAATHFAIGAPASATAGTAFNFTVTALDQFNNTATSYAGSAHFTSTDAAAILPANSTLTGGVGTFAATLRTAGNQTVTATDTVTSTITGTSNSIAVSFAVTDVAIVKAVNSPPPYGTGLPVSYGITVNNLGPATATAVTVTDAIPSGTTLISATPSQGTCSGTSTVTCDLGTIINGGSATITLILTLPATAGPLSNTATSSASNPDPNPANNSSTVTITVIPAAAIPMLSPLMLLLLAAMLTLLAMMRLRG